MLLQYFSKSFSVSDWLKLLYNQLPLTINLEEVCRHQYNPERETPGALAQLFRHSRNGENGTRTTHHNYLIVVASSPGTHLACEQIMSPTSRKTKILN